jgi:hypothetical protein
MRNTEISPRPAAAPVGEEALAAVQKAVREALIEHHKAGQKVPTWRDGKVVWVAVNENGEYAE